MHLLEQVGSSGAGKSTLFHLVQHFYEPTGGRLTFDGVDLSLLDHRWLHRTIALVGQEPVLFSGTIGDNIRYGAKGATDAAVAAAAEQAHAAGFIRGFPKGFDSEVGERGVQLSGGQKQRIAIARAVLMQPAVLLLDEATSALDAESEAEVQKAMEASMEGRTVLLIARRLSTVARADQIVMMDRGIVVEMGTHAQLMSKPPPREEGAPSYRALVERQMVSPSAGGGVDG